MANVTATIYAAQGVASVVIGTLSPEHLRENVDVAEDVISTREDDTR